MRRPRELLLRNKFFEIIECVFFAFFHFFVILLALCALFFPLFTCIYLFCCWIFFYCSYTTFTHSVLCLSFIMFRFVFFFFSVSLSLTPQSSYTHFYLALFLFFLVYTERRKIKTVFFSLVFSFGVHLHRTDQFTWCRKYFVCLLVCVAIMFVYACLCKNILLFQFDVYVEK